MEDEGGRVRRFPTLRQLSLHGGQRIGKEPQVVHAPVDSPVRDGELLGDHADEVMRPAAVGPGIAVLAGAGAPVGDGAAVLGRGYHLPGGGVEHHLLLGSGRLLAVGGGERKGSRQRERQRQQHESRSHNVLLRFSGSGLGPVARVFDVGNSITLPRTVKRANAPARRQPAASIGLRCLRHRQHRSSAANERAQPTTPPFTAINWPLMNPPRSEHSSPTTAAMSSGTPRRPTGICCSRPW